MKDNRQIELAKSILEAKGYKVEKINEAHIEWKNVRGYNREFDYEDGYFLLVHDIEDFRDKGWILTYNKRGSIDSIDIPGLTRVYSTLERAEKALENWIDNGGFDGANTPKRVHSNDTTLSAESWEDIPEQYPALSKYVEAFNDIYEYISNEGIKIPRKKFGGIKKGKGSSYLILQEPGSLSKKEKGDYLRGKNSKHIISIIENLNFDEYDEIVKKKYFTTREWKTIVKEGDYEIQVTIDLEVYSFSDGTKDDISRIEIRFSGITRR